MIESMPNKCNTIYLRFLYFPLRRFCAFSIAHFTFIVRSNCSVNVFLWIQTFKHSTLYNSRIPCIDPWWSMLFGVFENGAEKWENVFMFKFTLNESGDSSICHSPMEIFRNFVVQQNVNCHCIWIFGGIEMQKFCFEITILQWPEMPSTIEQSQILAISLKYAKWTNELSK